MNKKLYLTAAATLFFVITSMGCYTVLKHPQVELAREAEAHEEEEFGFEAHPNRVTFGDDCQSCHNAEVGAYHAIAVPAPVATPSPRWEYYYETPWWFPYYASSGQGSGSESAEQKKRSFDRRRNSVPEETSGSSVGSAVAPVPVPSAGAVAKPAGDNTPAASTGAKTEDDSNKRTERRSSETEKKEAPRRDRKP